MAQPNILKEINQTDIYLKISKSKLDIDKIFFFESDINCSDMNIPLDHSSLEFIKEKEGSKNFDEKLTENLYKKSQKANVQFKTPIEKKSKKNKMLNFIFLLSTIFVVRDFISKLRNLSFLRSSSKLKKSHFNLIGDKSYVRNDNNNFACEYFNQKFGEIFWIFDPSKNVSIFLDFVILIALSYYFLMIPLHFTYKSLAANSLKVELDSLVFYILAFDILRTFNTAIYLKGKLVYSRWKIAVNYLKQDFFFDFISLTPAFLLIMDIYQYNYEYFLILFYLKIKNFKAIITKLEQLLLSNRKFQHGLSLIKLIVWIIFITHSFACIWNGVGLVGDKHFEKTWLKENSLDHADLIDQYLFSYYFVCVTMNTVGFGDITPTNK